MMYLSVIRLAFTSITILICLLLYLRETHQYYDVNIVHKFTMLSKMVIQNMLKGNKKGTRRMFCLEYTLSHNQKKKHHIPKIHL